MDGFLELPRVMFIVSNEGKIVRGEGGKSGC